MKISPSLGPHRAGEVLVKLRPQGVRLQSDFCSDYQTRLLETLPLHPNRTKGSAEVLHLKLPAEVSTAEALVRMQQDPRVEYAAPNSVYFQDGLTPNDLSPELYAMKKIQAEAAWALTVGSRSGPVVAVLDTGVDYNHPDLKDNMWVNPGEIPGNGQDDDGNGIVDDVHGYASGYDSGDPMTKDHHGTHVSGTIAAVGNNGEGVVGLNWQARLLAVNIFGGFGADAVSITKGLNYAAQMGARIASNSWGGGVFNPVIYEAFKNSPQLHICAAGNNAKNIDQQPHYPASFDLPNVVSVAATDDKDQLPRFSSYGPKGVDLAAPGQAIFSTVPEGGYEHLSGTSMATPHVSGVAALIATLYPEADNQEIRARLLGGIDKVPALQGKVASGGRLNALKCLEKDVQPPSPPVGLTASARGSHQIKLGWVAGGDDGQQGAATFYQVRYARQPIVDGPAGPGQIGFEEATALASPNPQAAGSKELLEWTLMPSAQAGNLYCAIRAVDNVGLTSATAKANCPLPAARLALDAPAGSGDRWTPQGSWEVVDLPGIGPVWTDSPHGDYLHKSDMSLTGAPFSLKGMQGCKLLFEGKYSIEREKDQLMVEASQDGGKSWKAVQNFEGDQDWGIHQVDLSGYDNSPQLQLRFRLKTDATGVRDGFFLGRAVVAAG